MASLTSRFFSLKAFHSFGDPVRLADLCRLFLVIIFIRVIVASRRVSFKRSQGLTFFAISKQVFSMIKNTRQTIEFVALATDFEYFFVRLYFVFHRFLSGQFPTH